MLVAAPQAAHRIRLPIEIRIALGAIGFRVIGAFVGFIANLTIPDYQDQGFTVLDQPVRCCFQFPCCSPVSTAKPAIHG